MGYSEYNADTRSYDVAGWVPSAPDYIISIMIKCSCENCGSARCSCVSYVLPCRPTVFCRCDDSNECLNSRRGLMLLCKCQIQIVIRKITNKGIAMICQHINDSLGDRYITKPTMLICLKTLIGQIGLLRAMVRIYRPV